jgi:DNA-binding NarL/FixJ family response regulator
MLNKRARAFYRLLALEGSMRTASVHSIRVLLIDDHVIMRMGLRLMIESQPGITVVGEATTRADALRLAAQEQPDIILLDLDLGDESGHTILPNLLAVAAHARVIVLTGLRDLEAYRRAVRLGAVGIVLKEQALDTLIQAIKNVHSGEAWLDRALVTSLLVEGWSTHDQVIAPEEARIAALTAREREVIALICQGLPNKLIAERLHLSQTTVVHHLTSIFSKLGVTNRLELQTYAYSHRLVDPPR